MLLSLIVFGAGGVYFYFSISEMLNEDVTDNAFLMKRDIQKYVKQHHALPPESPIGKFRIHYQKADHPVKVSLVDTLLPDEDEEPTACRSLIFPLKINDNYYTATINVQLVEKDELTEEITGILFVLIGALLVLLLVGYWIMSRRLWKPFHRTLGQLKQFDITAGSAPRFGDVRTQEFRQLNDSLQHMTDKIVADFKNLKEFTENAAHELQTPLAIIRSKMEQLIQSKGLNEEQAKLIGEAYETTGRLTRLNQSLLLLAKIENRQFADAEEIELSEMIQKKHDQLSELAELKNIKINLDLNVCRVKINPYLADVLLSNLISNAIRHNTENGMLNIQLQNKTLAISNSGIAPDKPVETLTERFKKGSSSSDSVGLGLAIVKQICELYKVGFSYTYSGNLHRIELRF